LRVRRLFLLLFLLWYRLTQRGLVSSVFFAYISSHSWVK
jgi:hypothetical protein